MDFVPDGLTTMFHHETPGLGLWITGLIRDFFFRVVRDFRGEFFWFCFAHFGGFAGKLDHSFDLKHLIEPFNTKDRTNRIPDQD